MIARNLYQRSPVAVQNAFATAYGIRELPRRHGGSFRGRVADFDARQWWSADMLQRDQDSRIRSMVVWCAARVPYYRDLFAELGLGPGDIKTAADFALLPVLDKDTVREGPQRFLPDGVTPKVIEQTTGGTTGTPVKYWATLEAVRMNYAVYESRCRGWAGVRLGDRMASFHGQPIVPASQQTGPFWRRNPAFNQTYFSVYHLNESTLPSYVGELRRLDPRLLVGYTSAIHRLARHLLEHDLVGVIRPAAVMVSSEALTPAARADMEAAFGCRVTNSYSLGELVAHISECDHGELHVSPEYGVVEQVRVGDAIEIVASGLINKGMPLLRYRTGDVMVPSTTDTSRCGRELPLIGEILGRVDDVVHTPEGSTVGPAPMSLAFQRVPNLRRALVRQDRVDELQVLLEVTPAFGEADEDFLRRELQQRLGTTIRLRFERVDTLPRTSGGKERLVVSSIRAGGTP